MQRNRATELKVGLFVVVSLFIGGALAFVIGNQRNVFRAKVEYRATFQSVGGLRSGSPVRMAGVDVGTVTAVELGEDGLIHVRLGIVDEAAPLVREDSLAIVGNKGLLGDRLVDVTVGRGEPIPEGGEIPTETPMELSQYLARAGTILDDVEGTVHNLRAATEPLADEQLGQDLRATLRNLATLTTLAAEEDGTVRRLLADEALANDLHATVRGARSTTEELSRAARGARAILDEVRTGDGGAHALVYGQDGARLVTNLADATGELATLVHDVRTGDGVVHELVYEDAGGEVVANLEAMSSDLRAVVADLRAGRGTIGALLVDPSIYEDVKRLIGDLQRNEILRALVRYSIRNDEARGTIVVEPAERAAPAE